MWAWVLFRKLYINACIFWLLSAFWYSSALFSAHLYGFLMLYSLLGFVLMLFSVFLRYAVIWLWSDRGVSSLTVNDLRDAGCLQNVNLPKVSPRNLPLMIYRPRIRQSCRRSFPFLFTVWSWLFLWIWENVLLITVSLLLMYLLPCVSVKSGFSPVLVFRSPQMSTFPWAWKWLVSSSNVENVSSL